MPEALAEIVGVSACFLLKSLAWYTVTKRKKTQVGRVGQIIFYPVKSCCGIELNEADITDAGILYNGVRDRSYIIMSSNDNRFVSLKVFSPLAKVQPKVDPSNRGTILLSAEDHADLRITHTRNEVVVGFKTETIQGVDCGDEAGNWLNAVCGRDDLRLVYCPDAPRSVGDRMRNLDKQNMVYDVYSSLKETRGNHISFADKSPIMLMSDASVKTLNELLSKDQHSGTDWRNFRPNIVVSDVKADADEDRWGFIYAENFALAGAFPCERCVMVNLDHNLPQVAAPPGDPVLSTLRTYRAKAPFRNPLFGVCCSVELAGRVRSGEPLYADI